MLWENGEEEVGELELKGATVMLSRVKGAWEECSDRWEGVSKGEKDTVLSEKDKEVGTVRTEVEWGLEIGNSGKEKS